MLRKVILCQNKRAENPYYIEDVDLYIYSIEELCYFVNTNLPLIDEAFFEEPLTEWLDQELNLKRLVQTMRGIREESENVLEHMIAVLNAETSWTYAEDRKAFASELEAMQRLSEADRIRRKADALVNYHKYTKAISIYKQLLDGGYAEETDHAWLGMVYHNIGVAYAKLFQLDEACDCLRKAYQYLHSAETLKNYLYCIYINKGEDAFHKLADELEVDTATREEMEQEMAAVTVQKPEGDMDAVLNHWVREYHRETGL